MDTIVGSASVKGHVYPGRAIESMLDNPSVEPCTIVESNIGEEVQLPGCWNIEGRGEPNQTLFSWGKVVGELLRGSPDDKSYNIGGLYLEFENNSGATVTPPVFDRTGGKSYYDGLSSSGTRDYLRVPLTAALLDSTDLVNFPDGNRITFFAQSSGVAGVHGKTFSDGVMSRVFGGALVAFPTFSDASQDIVHSRFYFEVAANQLIKQAGSQITMTWPLSLQ